MHAARYTHEIGLPGQVASIEAWKKRLHAATPEHLLFGMLHHNQYAREYAWFQDVLHLLLPPEQWARVNEQEFWVPARMDNQKFKESMDLESAKRYLDVMRPLRATPRASYPR